MEHIISRPSNSFYYSESNRSKKIDVSGKKKLRNVVDYRMLNEEIIDCTYIPNIFKVLDELGRRYCFQKGKKDVKAEALKCNKIILRMNLVLSQGNT